MRYHIRCKVRSSGKIIERSFSTPLLRTLFLISFEGEGLGSVLAEWESST